MLYSAIYIIMNVDKTFETWIPRFVKYMEAHNYSSRTIVVYSRVVRLFAEGRRENVDVVPADVDNFMTANSHLSPATIHQYASALETFYRFLIKQEVVITNPVAVYERPKIKERELKYLKHEEVMAFIDALPKARDKLIVRMIYATGMRISELCKLRVECIDFGAGTVKVLGKGGKFRIVCCDEKTLSMVREFLEGRTMGYVFLGYKDQPIDPSTVQRFFERYAPEGITPHKIRHSFATDLYQSSHDLSAVQQLLGHKSIKTTEIYLHTDMEQCKAAYSMRRLE